jgi:replicative DNA helicase
MNIQPLDTIQAIDAEFILKDKMPIPKNAVTLLSATGGLGKTRYALICASRHIADTGENVALWLTEDYKGQVRAIFDSMAKAGLVKSDTMSKMMIILDPPPQLALREHGVFKANYKGLAEIEMGLKNNNIKFCVFDPLLAFYGGNENDNSEARVFIQTFAEFAKDSEITVLIIHHANKEGRSRGATAFSDGVRCRYEMTAPMNEKGTIDKEMYKKGLRVLSLEKDNWGAAKPFFKMTDGEQYAVVKISVGVKETISPEIVEYSFPVKVC